MNKGLKEYTKQITQNVGNVGVSVNLSNEDANTHITIPVLKSTGFCPIETSLVYNYQDRDKTSKFGAGFKLNCYTKAESKTDGVYITNADGTVDKYLEVDNYYNKETNNKLTVCYSEDDEGTEDIWYELVDNTKNKIVLTDYSDYPRDIKLKNGEGYKINETSNYLEITNASHDKIKFTYNQNKVTKASYTYRDVIYQEVLFTYNGNKLSKVSYYEMDNLINEVKILYSDEEILIKDMTSRYMIRYTLTNGKVTSFTDGPDFNHTLGKTTTITYNGNHTIVTNHIGEKNHLFFGDQGLPLYEMDDKGNVVFTEFDSDTKKIITNSSIANLKNEESLLPYKNIGGYLCDAGLTFEWTNSTIGTIFEEVVGTGILKVTNTGTSNKSLWKEFDINGVASDNLMLVIWGKQLSALSKTNEVVVTLSANNGKDSISKSFNKEVVDGVFELKSLGFNAQTTFDKLTIKITIPANTTIELGGLQLFRKNFGAFYEYEESGNVCDINTGQGSVNLKYDQNNQVSEQIGADSATIKLENSSGRVEKATAAYGAKVKYTYDSTYKSNVLSTKVSDKKEIKILETTKDYTSDGKFVTAEYDELENVIRYEYDGVLGKIKKVTNALGQVTKYDYNLDTTLQKLNFNDKDITYEYDDLKRLNKIITSDLVYEFIYDNQNNISEVKLNGNRFIKYEYDLATGNIVKQYSGLKDSYEFEYKNQKLIETVSYVDESGNKLLRFKYEYDDKERLVTIKDSESNVLKEFTYNSDNKLESTSNDEHRVKVTYDNLGNVNREDKSVEESSIVQTYDTVSRSKGASPDVLYSIFKEDEYSALATFEDNTGIIGNIIDVGLVLQYPVRHNEQDPIIRISRDGIIPQVELSNNQLLTYNNRFKGFGVHPNASYQFWFKPENITSKQYLLNTRSTTGNSYIDIYMENELVYVDVRDDRGVTHNKILQTTNKVILGKWNYLGLSYMERQDEGETLSVSEYGLMLNSKWVAVRQTNPRIECGLMNQEMNFGHKYNGATVSNPFTGYMTFIHVRNYYTRYDEMLKYYRYTKDCLIDNQVMDDDLNTVDFSATSAFKISNNNRELFEIFPLQNSVESLNGVRPVKFEIRNISAYDKDRTFNFNKENKRYSFVSDGNEIVYDLGMTTEGTILLKAFTDTTADMQYFFEGKDDQGHTIGLFRDSSNMLNIDFNGTKISTGLSFETNQWHTLGLSYRTVLQSSSTEDVGDRYFRVILDDQIEERMVYSSFDYSNIKLSIGRKHSATSILSYLGDYSTAYPLHGQIEMMCTRCAYCETETLTSLISELSLVSKYSAYDDLGMLKRKEIHKDGQSLLSNTYNYKTRKDNDEELGYIYQENSENYISKQIQKEVIKTNNTELTTRTYKTNQIGQVLNITDQLFGNKEYQYDNNGYLIRENNTLYEYDDYGNITKKGNKIFIYDGVIKNRLNSYNGNLIGYHSHNPFLIKYYKGQEFTFEGKRLVRIDRSVSSDEEESILYTYDESGQRILKQISHCYNDDREPWDETLKYYYSQDKLITQISSGLRLDFLYDENNTLIGFIKDNIDKYFYVRDILNNILGIIDFNGNLVVKYDYDAYGNLVGISGEKASTIGKLNPFRYKGYYYDSETEFFYCKSRYYSPELCRFISPDSIEYLEQESIVGLNLYCYCGNDPVNRYDPDGHWGLSALIGAVVGFAGTMITDFLDDGKIFNGSQGIKDYLGNTLAGGIGGLAGDFGLNMLGSMAFSVAGDTIGGLISGDIDSLAAFGQTVALSLGMSILSSGISSAVSDMFGKSKYKAIRGISNNNTKVNNYLKGLSGSYKKAGVNALKIGANSIDDFLKALRKTTSNIVVSELAGNLASASITIWF